MQQGPNGEAPMRRLHHILFAGVAHRGQGESSTESLKMQNQCAELKLRAERKAGGLLAQVLQRGKKSSTVLDFGINHNQSQVVMLSDHSSRPGS